MCTLITHFLPLKFPKKQIPIKMLFLGKKKHLTKIFLKKVPKIKYNTGCNQVRM